MIQIIPEKPPDYKPIYDINSKEFETDAEAKLVDKLRGVADPFISLVAKENGIVLGHILFTPVTVGNTEFQALGLGPMAVCSTRQGQGIGSALITEGLLACREIGVVFVLGEPEFYTKFGFEPASKKHTYYKSDEFSSYFFVIELMPGALEGIRGEVFYHPLFDEL